MPHNTAIQIDNLSKVYRLYESPQDRLKEALHPLRRKYHKEFHALNEINMVIKKGETIGLIGQNGAGKSTLLKTITGVLTPTSGSLSVNGKISALLELGAGFNPQLTGLENVYFNGAIMGYTREEIDGKLDDILSFADIGDFIRQPVNTYSSGMFVRLAFAVAVTVEPEILIVDEALSVGDMMFQAKCYEKIKQLMSGGVTTLFVTHNMNTIASFCSRAYMLDGGRIFCEGNPKEVTLAYYQLQREREHARQGKTKIEEPTATQNEKPVQTTASAPMRAQTQEKEQRYGVQTARIIDYRVFNDKGEETVALETGQPFTVWMHVVFDGYVENPCLGMMLRNLQGQNLLGVHSFHERRMNFGVRQQGDEIGVTFKTEMVLNPGKYTLNLGVSDHETDLEFTSLDARNHVLVLDVYGKQFSYGLIHSHADIIVEDL